MPPRARERVLQRDGRPIALTPKVFETLLFFVENAGRLIEKEELMESLWPGTFVEEGNLTFNISVLRKALGEWENGNNYIKTVPKRGYRFVAPVRVVGAVPEPPQMVAAPVQPVGAVHEPPLPNLWLANRLWFALAGAALVIAVALVYWVGRPLPPPVLSPITRQLTHDSLEKDGPLLTDGPRLYFQEKRGDRWVLVTVSAAGGEPSVVPVPLPGLAATDISADGTQFLGRASEGADRISTWPVTGGPAQYVGELRGSDAVWSPDGARIAYIDERNRLMIAGRNGEAPREIRVPATGSRWFPQWSPDGRMLRFSVQDPESQTSSLWEVRADGSNPRRMLSAWADAPTRLSAAGWNPNTEYSFIGSVGPEGPSPDRSDRGSGADLWMLRENCGLLIWRCRKPVPVGIGATRYFAPLVSRDGKSVFAIGSERLPQSERYDQSLGAFVPYLSGAAAADLDFSRDGNWVAYTRVPDYTLWRSKSDGTDPLQLTSSTTFAEARRPHWSPDGRQIAFMGVSVRQHYKAYVVPASGGIPQPLVEGEDEEGVPTWSPDGKRLVWGEPLDRGPPSEMTIHQVDLSARQVTLLPDSAGFWTARWSPDGHFVAAIAIDAATGDVQSRYPETNFRPSGLWVLNLGTQQWSRLVRITHIQELTWANDSKYAYFNTVGSDHAVYRLRIADGNVERLWDLQGLSSSSDWAGVTPDGSLLIVHSFPVQEVYALDITWP